MTIVVYGRVGGAHAATVPPRPMGRAPGRALARAREVAARCTAEAARRAGAGSLVLERGADGAPLASDGRAVSLSNTRGLAAAALSDAPVGVDVEWLGRARLRAARESAGRDELRWLGDGTSALLLLWTAKEAVLKKLRLGLSSLSRCRLVESAPENSSSAFRELTLALDGARHAVVSRALPDHWLSVASAESDVSFHALESLEAEAAR